MKKLALSALVLAFAVSGATTGAEAQSRAKAKPAGPEAMIKQCQEATKGMYTADQRVFTYGYCVSRLNYYGNQRGNYGAQAAYGGQPQYYRGQPAQPPYRGQPAQPPYRGQPGQPPYRGPSGY